MRLHILGAGTPYADADRFGSSYILEVGGESIMFDCGPGATYKMARMGLRTTDVDHLLFTHHHFDHDVDYPCFLLARWNESIGDENPLQVVGPKLTELVSYRLMDENEGAFAHDWIARINHPLSLHWYAGRGGKLPRPPLTVNARDVGPGPVHSGNGWQITAAPAEHVEPWLDSLAYRLDSNEGSVVVTGDTRPCDSVEELANNADVMVCMCVYVQEDVDGTPDAEYMSGSLAAARMAEAACVRKLVLVHQSHTLDEPGQTERALADISSAYSGQVVWGRELVTIEL
jgi:ribonuclease Z